MSTNYKPQNKSEDRLADAFTQLKSKQEALNFMRDLMTPAEIKEFSKRLDIARLLKTTNLSYIEIAEKIGVSTTTVTRVNQWLTGGCGGYQNVLK